MSERILFGLLADVSGSMADVYQIENIRIQEEKITRAHSIIQTLKNIVLAENNFNDNKEIFAIAFGMDYLDICDLIKLLEYWKERKTKRDKSQEDRQYLLSKISEIKPRESGNNYGNLISLGSLILNGCRAGDCLGALIEYTSFYKRRGLSYKETPVTSTNVCNPASTSGAPTLSSDNLASFSEEDSKYIEPGPGFLCDDYYVKAFEPLIWLLKFEGAPYAENFIRRQISIEEAGYLFEVFIDERESLKKVIETLPDECKTRINNFINSAISSILNTTSLTSEKYNDKEKEVVQNEKFKALQIFQDSIIKCNPKRWPMVKVATIINTLFDPEATQTVTTKSINAMLKRIKPFIYGDTPMCKAMTSARLLMQDSQATSKILLIISDGQPKDGNVVPIAESIKNSGVKIVSCYITNKNISEPKQLFDNEQSNWCEAAKTMFRCSSVISTTSPGVCLLLRMGWKVPISGNFRLFTQFNNPEILNEISSIISKLFESTDSLLNFVGNLALDQFINQSNTGEQPREQKGDTCYANAIATVITLATKRIISRDGGYPVFLEFRQKLIDKYGYCGANSERVLIENCPDFRLHYSKVDEKEARAALNLKHPVLACFSLTPSQWDRFGNFFNQKRLEVLIRQDIGENDPNEELQGHAVVLTKCDANSLTFMNSWGTDWADGGFFSIRDQSVLNEITFFHVYWTENDLSDREKLSFSDYCANKTAELISKIPVDLHLLKFRCPLCKKDSIIYEYNGNIFKAQCPKCNGSFNPMKSTNPKQLMQSLFICPRERVITD